MERDEDNDDIQTLNTSRWNSINEDEINSSLSVAQTNQSDGLCAYKFMCIINRKD
jgi:hypothetical protein